MRLGGKRIVIAAAQLALGAAVAWFVWRRLVPQWENVRTVADNLHPAWSVVGASCLVVLITYALLIETWRMVVAGWGERLAFAEAAQIWSISNLGRYLPGKVWQLGWMGSMASKAGVSPVAAAGSALVVTLINTVAGFVVAAATGSDVLGRMLHVPPTLVAAMPILAGAVLLAPQVLPVVLRRAAALLGRTLVLPVLPARVVWLTALASMAAWALYGVAFRLLSLGVLGRAPGAVPFYIAVFTGSYLLGFVALFAPSGLGVREVAMTEALHRAGFDVGSATVLVVTSRLWLTVLEIVPAVLFLAYRAVRRKS